MARDRPAPGLAGEAASLLIPARCEEEGASPSTSSFGTRGDDGLPVTRRDVGWTRGSVVSRVARVLATVAAVAAAVAATIAVAGASGVAFHAPGRPSLAPLGDLQCDRAFSVPREASSDRFSLPFTTLASFASSSVPTPLNASRLGAAGGSGGLGARTVKYETGENAP